MTHGNPHGIRLVLSNVAAEFHEDHALPIVSRAVRADRFQPVSIRINLKDTSKSLHPSNMLDGKPIMIAVSCATEAASQQSGSNAIEALDRSSGLFVT